MFSLHATWSTCSVQSLTFLSNRRWSTKVLRARARPCSPVSRPGTRNHSAQSQSVSYTVGSLPTTYWGYEEKATRYNRYLIGEPEKALLDWIYLNRQEGLLTPFDELQLQFLNLAKLRKYAERFPRTVQAVIKDLLLEKAFPLEDPDHRRRNKGRVALT